MGSFAFSQESAGQHTVILPELDEVNGAFASPGGVAASPLSNAAQIEGSMHSQIHQIFEGMQGQEVNALINTLMDSQGDNNELISEMAELMADSVGDAANVLGDKLTTTQQGEPGQFADLIKMLGGFMMVAVLGVWALITWSKKK